MKMELDGRVALVTGGSKGMGRATAAALAAEGCEVCLLARSPEALEVAAAAIAEQTGREVLTFVGDVARADLAQEAVDAVIARFARIDILINNAGGPPMGSFLDHDEAAWNNALRTNFLSVVEFTRAVTPHMLANAWGRVINITSTLAKEPTSRMVLSASARAAVSAFSKSVSAEFAPHNITINTVLPGGVLTDRLVGLIEAGAAKSKISYNEQLKVSQSSIPLDRFAAPEEIADVIVFLASERGSYVTGINMVVDGALTKSAF